MRLVWFARLGLGLLLIALGGRFAAAAPTAVTPAPQLAFVGSLALDDRGTGWAWGGAVGDARLV